MWFYKIRYALSLSRKAGMTFADAWEQMPPVDERTDPIVDANACIDAMAQDQ